MLLALSAASSALDALNSLTSSKSTAPKPTGVTQDPANPFDLSGATQASTSTTTASRPGGCPPIAPETMSALLAAQSQSSTGATVASTSRSDALKDLFSQIDSNGDGQLSKSEFENALGAGGTNTAQADDVFKKMDKNGDGSVSLDEMMSALKGGKGHHGHHKVADSDSSSGTGANDGSNTDPLLKALQGATSTSTSNSDGSSTTSLTYADGSTVTMTTPAKAAASGAATSSYNFIEQMIAREAKTISSASLSSLSVSA